MLGGDWELSEETRLLHQGKYTSAGIRVSHLRRTRSLY